MNRSVQIGLALLSLVGHVYAADNQQPSDANPSQVKVISAAQYVHNSQTITQPHAVQQQLATAPAKVVRKSNTRFQNQLKTEDFWIYDARVLLDTDFDFDGYYTRLVLEFDADTVFNQADIYAVLHLGRDNRFESFYVTDVFTIHGASSIDELVVDTEFVNGFAPFEYELLIELYHAHTDELVAVADGFSDPDLNLLFIESAEFDVDSSQIVVVEESGGSLQPWYLLLLCFAVLGRLNSK